MTPSQARELVESVVVRMNINKEWVNNKIIEKKFTHEKEDCKVVFIPKNIEKKEKYSSYILYTLTYGVWMGKFSYVYKKPKFYPPNNVMSPDYMKQLGDKEKLINGLDYKIPEEVSEPNNQDLLTDNLQTVEEVIV